MAKHSPFQHINILVVDDDRATRKLLTKIISKEGYVVEGASSAEMAMGLIVKNQYRIVISDITMPNKDGLELLSMIKQHDPLIQVIMMTTGVTMEKTLQALELGASELISKPLNHAEVLMIIRLYEGKLLRWWSIMKTTMINSR